MKLSIIIKPVLQLYIEVTKNTAVNITLKYNIYEHDAYNFPLILD